MNVRGLGSDRSGNQANGVGFFVDGVYQYGTARFNAPFLDIERVEVLKGPQGARYGRNAFAGVVNIITQKPGNEFNVSAQTELESENGQQFGGSLSGPIVHDALYGKLSYSYSTSDGDYVHSTTGRDMMSVRDEFVDGRLVWQSTDRLEFDLKGSWGEHLGPGYAYSQVQSLQHLTENFVMDDDQTAGLDFTETTLGTTWRGDSFQISNRVGYYHAHTHYDIDADFSQLDIVRAGLMARNTQWTDELRIQSAGDGPLTWLFGGEIVHASAESTATSTLRPGLCPLLGIPPAFCPFPRTSVGPGEGDTDVWSAFAEVSYEFADRLELTVSGRYDDIAVHSRVPTPEQQFEDSAVQPLVSLRYRIDDETTIYASGARGIRQGGFNPVTVKASFRPYDSDDVVTYELGYKRALRSVRGHINLAAFYSDVRAMNHYIGLPPAPGFTTFPGVFSLGGAESYGFEIDLSLDLTDNLQWNVAAASLDCKLRDIPALTGPDYTAVPGNLTNGAKCVDASDWTFSASLSGAWALGASDWETIGSVSVAGRGDTQLVYDAGTPWGPANHESRTYRRQEEIQEPCSTRVGASAMAVGWSCYTARISRMRSMPRRIPPLNGCRISACFGSPPQVTATSELTSGRGAAMEFACGTISKWCELLEG